LSVYVLRVAVASWRFCMSKIRGNKSVSIVCGIANLLMTRELTALTDAPQSIRATNANKSPDTTCGIVILQVSIFDLVKVDNTSSCEATNVAASTAPGTAAISFLTWLFPTTAATLRGETPFCNSRNYGQLFRT
jgi:hypothetical protein